MDKKKIILMASILGVLVIGVVVFVFGFGGLGNSEEATNPGGPTTGPSQPSSQPSSQPMSPSAPVSSPPTSTASMAMPPGGPGMSSSPAATKVFVDPFKGNPRPYVPKPTYTNRYIRGNNSTQQPPDNPIVIIKELPSVVSEPSVGDGLGVPVYPDEAGIPGVQRDAYASLGRNVGWIASDTQGRVTAYFQLNNGGIQAVNVGENVNGYRVKAIEKNYILLVDDRTGHEERVQLRSGQGYKGSVQETGTPVVPTSSGRGIR